MIPVQTCGVSSNIKKRPPVATGYSWKPVPLGLVGAGTLLQPPRLLIFDHVCCLGVHQERQATVVTRAPEVNGTGEEP